jgi:hypothetical protein
VKNTIVIIATLIAAGAWLCCGGSEERTDVRPEETAGTVTTNTSEETTAGEELSEPLSDYEIKKMEELRSVGYPVYDKNVTTCSGVTSPSNGEFVILRTADEKDRVVEFYVEAGGTPDYYENGTEIYRDWGGPPDVETYEEDYGLGYEEEEVVLFRDWEMPVGVRASRDGDGTEVIYDVLGDVFSVETE